MVVIRERRDFPDRNRLLEADEPRRGWWPLNRTGEQAERGPGNQARFTPLEQVTEWGEWPEDSVRALGPAESAEAIAMSREMELVKRFQEDLARYRVYSDHFRESSEVVTVRVSFQCLADNQTKEVTEVLGIVEL